MARGLRQPDIIATQLDYFIHHVLDIRPSRKRELMLADISNHFLFLGLIQSAKEASAEDNADLAAALLAAAIERQRSIPLIDEYARRFIYPHRARPSSVVVFKFPD